MEDVLQSPNLTSLATRPLSARARRRFAEARIAAERVPKGEQLKHAVTRG
jgi:hypothetical protein